MKKYLGNKSSLANGIFDEILEFTEGNFSSFFDAFAGTNNVGRLFKQKGYQVLSNDINEVSYVLGKAYIENNEYPKFSDLFNNDSYHSSHRIRELMGTSDLRAREERLVDLNQQVLEFDLIPEYDPLITVLTYLTFFATEQDFSNDDDPATFKVAEKDFIYRNYCEYGSNSEYINLVTYRSLLAQARTLKKVSNELAAYVECSRLRSSLADKLSRTKALFVSFGDKPYTVEKMEHGARLLHEVDGLLEDGSVLSARLRPVLTQVNRLARRKNHTGRRKFFSDNHGRRIDIILNTLIYWKNNGLITEMEHYILLCSLLESVALFSNTSATYQAFYKTYRDNTRQEFRLVIPEVLPSTMENRVFNEDTFDLVQQDITYDVIYLDPPYNWRLYDSNYHLLNLIAKYHTIQDLLSYETGIIGASGEYRGPKEESYTNYSTRSTFEALLFELIKNAKCRYVAISYSDSDTNHNKNGVDKSIDIITAFLSNPHYFEPGSFKITKLNEVLKFESRKNQKKQLVNELLFLAEKRNVGSTVMPVR